MVLAIFFAAHSLAGQTWNVNSSGDWGTGSNWSPVGSPNGVGAEATLGGMITADRTITVSLPVTLGSLTFNDNNRYTVSGGAITFASGSGTAAINAYGAGGGGTGYSLASAISLDSNLAVTRDSAGSLDISGTIANNGNTITVDSASTVRLDGAVSGAGGFVKNGSGTVIMGGTAANTYSGETRVNDGTLTLFNTGGGTAVAGNLVIGDGIGAVGSAVVNIVNFNEQIAGTSAVAVAADGRLILGAGRSETIRSLNASAATASVELSGSKLTIGSGSSTFAGVVSGGGDLSKIGTGTLTLTGANTYGGVTAIGAGSTINIQNASALGSVSGGTTVYGGGQLQIQGGINVAENLTINKNGSSDTGALRSISGNNTLGGSIMRASDSGIQTDANQLTISGPLLGDASVTFSGTGNTVVTGTVSGAGILTKTGTGTLALSGNNTYTARTEINGGTLAIISDNNLGTAPETPSPGFLRFNGGTLNTSATFSLNANRAITLNAGGGIFSQDSGTTLAYEGVISGVGGLTKTGSGTLRLAGGTGSNTYAGTTTVSDGTLALAKTAGENAVGTAAIILNSRGTLLLENTNQIGNSTAITLAGGTFSTGTGYSETLGALTLTADSTITLGAAIHNLRFGASNLVGWNPDATLTIYGWSGTGGLSGIAGQIFFGTDANALTFDQLSHISFNGYSGAKLLANGELVPMAVPEPAVFMAALLLAGLVLCREIKFFNRLRWNALL